MPHVSYALHTCLFYVQHEVMTTMQFYAAKRTYAHTTSYIYIHIWSAVCHHQMTPAIPAATTTLTSR